MGTVSDPVRSVRGLAPVLILIALVALGCQAPPPQEDAATPAGSAAAPAESEADIAAVAAAHQALVRAYESGHVESFVALLDDSPELLIFHPRVNNRFDGLQAVRDRMPAMFARLGDDATWTDVHALVSVEGDVAWLSCEFLLESGGLDQPFIGRATEVWVRRDDGWKLLHAHWSGNPEQDTL